MPKNFLFNGGNVFTERGSVSFFIGRSRSKVIHEMLKVDVHEPKSVNKVFDFK